METHPALLVTSHRADASTMGTPPAGSTVTAKPSTAPPAAAETIVKQFPDRFMAELK